MYGYSLSVAEFPGLRLCSVEPVGILPRICAVLQASRLGSAPRTPACNPIRAGPCFAGVSELGRGGTDAMTTLAQISERN